MRISQFNARMTVQGRCIFAKVYIDAACFYCNRRQCLLTFQRAVPRRLFANTLPVRLYSRGAIFTVPPAQTSRTDSRVTVPASTDANG